MTIETVKDALESEPFRPFVLHLADGAAIPVVNPHSVAFMRSGGVIFVAKHDVESYEMIDLLLVISIELGTVGAPKRRRSK